MIKDEEIKPKIDENHTANDSASQNVELPPRNPSSSKQNKKLCKALKVILLNNDTKFMSDFDPEQSNREKRKLSRKFTSDGKKHSSAHDENGVLSGSDKDTCDCLNDECPGCHFPCPKCRSNKCGSDCRVNRKWTYEEVEDEGNLRSSRSGKLT